MGRKRGEAREGWEGVAGDGVDWEGWDGVEEDVGEGSDLRRERGEGFM